MKGDFTRTTFNRNNHYSRVLMQQGRVQLDADWNEQSNILLDFMRTLAKDLIGPHGGPGDGFKIQPLKVDEKEIPCDFAIHPGHYYVDGILCAIDTPVACPPLQPSPLPYTGQPDYPLRKQEDGITIVDEDKLATSTTYLVYLDVWERHITYLQDPYIREVALGGPDTATRAQTVCQVKVWTPDKTVAPQLVGKACDEWLQYVRRRRYGCLCARALIDKPLEEPCAIPPEARYRGPENQLYRVEIHDSGEAGKKKGGATFKWSRDNGSVVFAIRSRQGSLFTVDDLGPDNRRSLEVGDWVEILDDTYELRGEPGPLLKVESIDPVALTVTLQVPADVTLPDYDEQSTTHPLLRRWESNALPVKAEGWLDLEDGVQVSFKTASGYETGDYWLIPARTATGDVEWPGPTDNPTPLPPQGIKHHYAPLAMIEIDAAGAVTVDKDCRCVFPPLCKAAEAPVEEEPKEVALEKVYFHRNTANLQEQSFLLLEKNTEQLAEEKTAKASLIGYAASQLEENAQELAMERARLVQKIYAERGIDPGRLAVAGRVLDEAKEDIEDVRRVDTIMRLKRVIASDKEKREEEKKRREEEAEKEKLKREKRPVVEAHKPAKEAGVAGGETAERLKKTRSIGEIPGVGPKFEKLMLEANITDAAMVSGMEPVKLAEILATPKSRAEKIITNARDLFENKP